MKKIFNGKLYDTETATEIWNEYRNEGTFNYVDESLFRTKKGNYFLAGEGGANSIYGVKIDCNSWTSGSDLIPMSLEEAMVWGELYMPADVYVVEFGEYVEEA